MKIGFYAPLKSPNHSVPSGDRKMARLLIEAFEPMGHDVELISEFRSYDGSGKADLQRQLRRTAEQEVSVLQQKYSQERSLDCIFVYHIYHKAPDWIGITLAQSLDIPYIVAEASYAPKQADGEWKMGHAQSAYCIRNAAAVLSFNPADMPCVDGLLSDGQIHQFVPPFLSDSKHCQLSKAESRCRIAREFKISEKCVWLICVAMMRPGDKLSSYEALSRIISNLDHKNWNLIIIGDGEYREKIELLFGDCDLVRFVGELSAVQVSSILRAGDAYVWPGINEAFGFSLLEAVMHGLPAISFDYGGISTIISNDYNGNLVKRGDDAAFNQLLKELVISKEKRMQFSRNAREKFLREHTLSAVSKTLAEFLENAMRCY